MKIEFRAALETEAEIIRDFQVQMAWETEKMKLDAENCLRGVRAVFANPALGRYFAGVVDGRVAASMLLQNEWSDWRNGMVWWIHSVFIPPQFRGLKLFSGLYGHVKALAESEPSVRGLRLYVDKSNKNAQAVYRKLGMNGDHYATFEWMK